MEEWGRNEEGRKQQRMETELLLQPLCESSDMPWHCSSHTDLKYVFQNFPMPLSHKYLILSITINQLRGSMKDIGGKSFLCCFLQTSKSTPGTERASEELLAQGGCWLLAPWDPQTPLPGSKRWETAQEQSFVRARQRLAACRNSCKEQEKGSSSLWGRIMGCKGEPESEGAFCSTQAKTRDKTDDVRGLEKRQ